MATAQTSGDGERNTANDKWLFIGLLYLGFFCIGNMYSPQPLLAVIASDFNITASKASLLISMAMLGLGLCPLFYGLLLSNISQRTTIAACVILLSATSLPILFISSYSAFLVLRTVQSLVFPALLTALMTAISTHYRGDQLQRAMAIYIGVTISGGMFFRILSGFLSTTFSWRISLATIALGMLPALFCLPLLSKDSNKQQRFEFKALSSICKSPGIATLLAMEWCTYFVFMGIANCLPFRIKSLDPSMTEFGVGLMYFGYIVGVLIAFCSKRVINLFGGEIRALRAGFFIAFCALPTLLVPHIIAMFLVMWIICAGQFLEHSINPGVINRLVTHHQSMVNGLYLSVYYAGGAFGSYFPPLVLSRFGWNWTIVLFTVVLLVGFFLSRRIHPALLENHG